MKIFYTPRNLANTIIHVLPSGSIVIVEHNNTNDDFMYATLTSLYEQKTPLMCQNSRNFSGEIRLPDGAHKIFDEITETFHNNYHIVRVKHHETYYAVSDDVSRYKNIPTLIDDVLFALPINLVELFKIPSTECISDKAKLCCHVLRHTGDDICKKIVTLFLELSRLDVQSYIS